VKELKFIVVEKIWFACYGGSHLQLAKIRKRAVSGEQRIEFAM
jgi:hypothetical protein